MSDHLLKNKEIAKLKPDDETVATAVRQACSATLQDACERSLKKKVKEKG